MSHGFITLVAREAVGDRDPRPHEANLYDMSAKYADVVSEAKVAGLFQGERALARSGEDARLTGARQVEEEGHEDENTVGMRLSAAAVAMAAAPALADGVADAKALVEKYSKLPTFEPPGPAFDAKACMAGKKIFVIPLTNANPFNVAIAQGMEQAAKIVGFPIKTWETQMSPDQWTQGINKAVEEGYNLIDLQGGLPPEFIAPQIAEARKKGVKVTVTHDYDATTQKAPDFLDGAANTDYVTVGNIIAAWAIAKTGGKVNAHRSRPRRDHADDADQERGHGLSQGEVPRLQGQIHQHAGHRMGDEDPARRPGGAARRPDDQLRPAGLRFDVAVHRAGDPGRRARRRRSSPTTGRPSCST